MGPTQERDGATALAKSDTAGALEAARSVSDPWFRAQALAWVARFSPDADVERIVGESLEACSECDEPYSRIAAAAWPLRALVERGGFDAARRMLRPLLEQESRVEPPSSRSEALFLLFQAGFALNGDIRSTLIQRLAAVHEVARHWRSRRNLVDGLWMLHAADPELTEKLVRSVEDERAKRRAEASVASGRAMEPRAFFW